jgi:homogentisate 1,2-dioxygenase
MTETQDLAVMCDTFRPPRLTTFARDLDDATYAHSWLDDTVGSTIDDDPAGVSSHL